MKAMVAVAGLMLLWASTVGAVDIKDKWGLGAGVFGGGGEVSLIRGHSERSAWLFDIRLTGGDDAIRYESVPPQGTPSAMENRNSFSILAGPGYRRFARPAEDFSPYWDVHLRGSFGRAHSSGYGISTTQKTTGAEGGFSFGLEYFTRWHFSVAAHSSLVRFSWVRFSERGAFYGNEYRSSTTASIGLSPVIFVRGYF